MKKIKWVASGLDSFSHIVDYLAEEDPAAARRTAKRVRDAIKNLAKQPSMGRAGRVAGSRELVLPGTPLIIVYQITKSNVEILRVLHSSQKWPPNH